MSRAFVKELDENLDDVNLPEKPQSEHTNYMTLQGLEKVKMHLNDYRQQHAKLKEQEDKLSAKNQIKPLEAEIRYLEKRIQCVIPVDVNAQSSDDIRFGATVELIDDEDSVKIKKKMLIAIKEWGDPALNLHDRDLKFLNKPDFIKFVSFNYQFRKAAMDCIMKPFLKKCLSNCGASTDTVTALLNCITPNQNMYKNCSPVAGKLIV